MIREHAFNTRWWGAPVGIVDDLALLGVSERVRAAALAPFAWVELRAPFGPGAPHHAALAAGFMLADVQLRFRVSLAALRAGACEEGLTCTSREEEAWCFGEGGTAPFEHERFACLPGVTPGQLAERYDLWARDLAERHPALALRLQRADTVQGWFLAEPSDGTLRLTLAAAHREANVSGLHLYRAALRRYARAGLSVAHASFSASNSAVHNIYCALGARFVAPEGCWLWAPSLAAPQEGSRR